MTKHPLGRRGQGWRGDGRGTHDVAHLDSESSRRGAQDDLEDVHDEADMELDADLQGKDIDVESEALADRRSRRASMVIKTTALETAPLHTSGEEAGNDTTTGTVQQDFN